MKAPNLTLTEWATCCRAFNESTLEVTAHILKYRRIYGISLAAAVEDTLTIAEETLALRVFGISLAEARTFDIPSVRYYTGYANADVSNLC